MFDATDGAVRKASSKYLVKGLLFGGIVSFLGDLLSLALDGEPSGVSGVGAIVLAGFYWITERDND